MNKIAVVLLIIACFFASFICARAVRQAFFSINSSGELATVNVQADVSNIDWGIVEIGENKTMQFSVLNNGNMPLQLYLTNDAPNYISTGWNLEGNVLGSGQTVTAEIWLLPSETSEPYFSFSYTITGVET